MAHTPGPWTVQSLEPYTFGKDWVDGPDRRCLAVCGDVVGNGPHGYCQLVDTDEIAANARLIAAAPDLLAALYRILEELPAQSNDHQWMEDGLRQAVEAAGAALAKAEPPS